MLRVPLNSAIEHHAFNLVAERCQLLHRHRMIDALHRLFNNGSFVEIAVDVVRRRTDQLNAALIGLVIGLCALEAG